MSAAPDDMAVDRDEQAALWCLTLADGALTGEEERAFDRWIADPGNAAAFEAVARFWKDGEAASDMPELVQMRTQALEHFRRENERRWTRVVPTRWRWGAGIAAGLIAAMLFVVLIVRDPAQTYRTGIGERQIVMLDDGSKLSLDADSQVDVRMRGDRRELTLTHGRAKFDVAKDPLRPFTVTAAGRMVVATGTSFSVELLERKVHVLLYEGRVAVLDRRGDRNVPQAVRASRRLAPAEQVLMPGGELVVSADTDAPATLLAVNAVQSLSWEAGQLSFEDEPLASAVARMNRYSRTQLVVGDDATAQLRVNGVFTAGDVETFVDGVTLLNPVEAAREPGQIMLRRR